MKYTIKYKTEEKTYKFREFSLIDLFEKKPMCKEWDRYFLDLMKECGKVGIDPEQKLTDFIYEDGFSNVPTLTKQPCLDWLVENGFAIVKETSIVPGSIFRCDDHLEVVYIARDNVIFTMYGSDRFNSCVGTQYDDYSEFKSIESAKRNGWVKVN